MAFPTFGPCVRFVRYDSRLGGKQSVMDVYSR